VQASAYVPITVVVLPTAPVVNGLAGDPEEKLYVLPPTLTDEGKV